MMKTYVIPHEPVAWKRTGHAPRHVYDEQKHLKLAWGILLKQQHENSPLFSGPLRLDITFFMPLPNTSQKRKALLHSTPHVFKPDYSNLLKLIEDIATGIIYEDDRQIAAVTGKKVYDDGNGPRTVFVVSEW